LGIAAELDEYEDGSALWRADPVSGNWTDETTLDDVTFDVDIHIRAIEQAPYQRSDE
jgi:hypothetical protein